MSIQQKSIAAVQLIRPELPASAGICVVVGQAVALGQLPALSRVALGFLLGFFLSASAMIFNDYFDLEVDRVNAPQRPYPSGRLTRSEVIALGVLTALLAWLIAFAIHPIALLLSLITWLVGFLYNARFKAAGLAGNLMVSYSVAMTFIMGGVSVGQAASPLVILFGIIAFVFDLAEEIAGDAMDIEGDRQRGSQSIAIRRGKPAALRISSLLFGLMIVLTVFPLLWGETSLGYWLPIALMDLLIVFFAARLVRSTTPAAGRASMRALYLTATLGLVAFVFGRFIR